MKLLLLFATVWCLSAPAKEKTLASLDTRSRDLLLECMRWTDQFWDERAGLLRYMNGGPRHIVRETSWYTVGLMLRDGPGDRDRAVRAIEAVLEQQVYAPGAAFDGTFFRAPEEPQPPLWPQMWTDYDPNWRSFIGTTWAILLNEWEGRLPKALRDRLLESIRRAVDGEIKEGRLKPSYTNIALMHGFLWTYAGVRLNKPEWVKGGEAWAQAVYDGFNENKTFEEYNSPTYYGVDLYGLALWRVHGPTEKLRRLGSAMETELWRDIASYYHAGLKNLAGPYDRSYGFDMAHYVSLTGLWLRTVLDEGQAPFPPLKGPLEHAADYVYTPCFVALGTKIPDDAMQHFKGFQGERQVTRNLPRKRVATAWIGNDVILGGEATGKSRAAGTPRNQLVPATAHWRTPSGEVGYFYLSKAPRLDARAERETLRISAIGDSTFRIHAAGLTANRVGRDAWDLPGLRVAVETDATGFSVKPSGEFVDVAYTDATRFLLRTAKASDATVWNFDRTDSIGGHATTVLGHPKVIDTPRGKAVEFNGVDDAVYVENHPLAGAEQFTWEAVFRPDGGAAEQRWFHLQENGSNNRMLFEIRVIGDQWCLDTFVASSKGAKTLIDRGKLFPLRAWYHVAAAYDGKRLRAFVNGVEQGSGEMAFAPQGEGRTSVGVRINRVNYFKGAVRTARFTRRALAPEEFLKGL